MDTERKVIPGYSRYSVTKDGKVFNGGGRLLSDYLSSNGYRRISLYRDSDGMRFGEGVHRLVVMAYAGEIPRGMWVNHKDGNKENNWVGNLEVMTPSENHLHASRVLKRRYARGAAVPRSVLTEEEVLAARELVKAGWSQHRVASLFQVSQPTICNILHGRTWGHVECE